MVSRTSFPAPHRTFYSGQRTFVCEEAPLGRWSPVILSPSGWSGFFLRKTPVNQREWFFEPLTSFSHVKTFLDLFIVNTNSLPRDTPFIPSNRIAESVGYLVVFNSVLTRPSIPHLGGLSVSPMRPSDESGSPCLALRLLDLVVHHYPGRFTSVTDGELPGSIEDLLTGV